MQHRDGAVPRASRKIVSDRQRPLGRQRGDIDALHLDNTVAVKVKQGSVPSYVTRAIVNQRRVKGKLLAHLRLTAEEGVNDDAADLCWDTERVKPAVVRCSDSTEKCLEKGIHRGWMVERPPHYHA